MGNKKKKQSSDKEQGSASAPTTAAAPEEEGCLLLQPSAPVGRCPSLCACFHWQALRKLGIGLGLAVLLTAVDDASAPHKDPRVVLLRAWASGGVMPKRVALSDEAHQALGPSSLGVRVYAAAGAAACGTPAATRIELQPVELGAALSSTAKLGSKALEWLGAQLLGAP
eukprot:6963851-Prymnesium_polylepis.1